MSSQSGLLLAHRMFISRLSPSVSRIAFSRTQNLSTSLQCRSSTQSKDAVTKTNPAKPVAPVSSSADTGINYRTRLTAWDKRVLVSTKTFPNVESIPDELDTKKLRNAQDKMRVKIASFLVVLILLICLVANTINSRARRNRTIANLEDHAKEQLGIK